MAALAEPAAIDAATLLHTLGVPIHQVVSHAELLSEDRTAAFAELPDILDACESWLRAARSLAADSAVPVDRLIAQLVELSRTILGRCESWRNTDPELLSSVTGANIDRLAQAARSLQNAARLADDGGPAATETPVNGAPRASAKSPKRDPKRPGGIILVVDDDEGNRDVLSRRLLRDAHQVMLAESGPQALRMLRRYDCDLVLLDITMPEMDGYEVLAEIKKDARLNPLPVIMITAVDDTESIARCIVLGAEDYLLKPFDPVILQARIGALLERKRLRDAEVRQRDELRKALEEVDQQRRGTERLLLNILPSTVARELVTNGSVQPMYFEDATITFADIVGFTLSAAKLPADELVDLLHEYFSAFDRIMSRYELEKLKTIGDCFMFAGGLPVRSPSHSVDSVLAALEMVQEVQERGKHGIVQWDLRVGIHTGPVTAGVVGIHKFAFDVWGDTVNFASRMESSGAPNRVNISSYTFSRVKDFFSCQKREKVRIKDGYEVEMYFIEGFARGMTSGKHGPPLEAFERRYRNYFRKDLRTFPEFLLQLWKEPDAGAA